MADYPHLFPKPIPATTAVGATTPPRTEQSAPDLLPLVKSESETHGSTAIDKALADKLGRDALLKVKAMEFVLQFLSGRTISDYDKIDKLYDLFYNKIKNGSTKRSQIR